MDEEAKRKSAPYSDRIFIGVSLMILMGLLWLKYLPEYPMEIALVVSLVVLSLLIKYR